jgi:nucleoside phosphorylase
MAPSIKEGENLRRLRNCPVCIICGRPGEAKQIAMALGIVENVLKGHEVAEVDNSQTFYYGSFELAEKSKTQDNEKQTDKEKLDYVLTSGTRQGIQSFTVTAALLFHILRPKFVIHAGVCAGYRDEEIK